MPKRKPKEIELYDWHGKEKTILRYKDRAASVKDPGVFRYFMFPEKGGKGSAQDPLCQLWWGDMLTGEALEDAKLICGPKPEGFVLPDRFYKPLSELEANRGLDY